MSHKAAKRERSERRDKVREFCIALIEAFQRRFRERAHDHYEQWPEAYRPCGTCALNPSTNDWPGQDQTALRLLTAVMRNAPFYCHDGAPTDASGQWQVDPATAPLCAGWGVVYGLDAEQMTIQCAREAFATVGVNFDKSPKGDLMLRRMLEQMAAVVDANEAANYHLEEPA